MFSVVNRPSVPTTSFKKTPGSVTRIPYVTEGSEPHRAKFRVPHHNRILSPPFQVEEVAGADKVDLRLKWRFKSVSPGP